MAPGGFLGVLKGRLWLRPGILPRKRSMSFDPQVQQSDSFDVDLDQLFKLSKVNESRPFRYLF